MKADAITVGGTYWDREKGLRKVLEMGVDAYGVRTLRYKLLSGKANGQPLRVESDGHRVFGCNLSSFQRWAKEQVMFGPDALK